MSVNDNCILRFSCGCQSGAGGGDAKLFKISSASIIENKVTKLLALMKIRAYGSKALQ